jgi:outer membrane protein insertion porin family
VCAGPAAAFAQQQSQDSPPSVETQPTRQNGIVRKIDFLGLRRISATTLRARIGSRENLPLDTRQIAADVRALDRLGWFDNVTAEVHELPMLLADAGVGASGPAPAENVAEEAALSPGLRLVFLLEERPFLAKVEYRGSRLLDRERIEAIFATRGLRPKLATPVDRTLLFKCSRAVQGALAELGHPQARVQVQYMPAPTAAVRAVFHIDDGPRVEAARVEFEGNAGFSDDELRKQLRNVAPHARFAGLRSKSIYTPERLAADLHRVAEFYLNHGYADARLGEPQVEILEDHETMRWFPWPRRSRGLGYRVTIPVEEGAQYRISDARVDAAAMATGAVSGAQQEKALRHLRPGEVYSAERVAAAREELAEALRGEQALPQVEAAPEFDREEAQVALKLRVRTTPPPTVRHIEFSGHHRFGDRYFRHRVGLKEGEPLDWRKLEDGLARLASTGFIRPVRREDIEVSHDASGRLANLRIRIEETGRQRISLLGGASGLGTTLGVVYNVFDLLGAEELLTGYLEGGPQSLNILFGVAREGVFGTRASLGFSLFHNVLRPYLPGSPARKRLYDSRSSGFGVNAGVPLSARSTLGFTYEDSRSSTAVPLGVGSPNITELRSRSARRAVGTNWIRATGRERASLDASVSGGALGGDENVLRGGAEYARLLGDPLSGGRNFWAFRSTLAGVSSFNGRALPYQRRFFGGDQFVRGFRPGELSPYAAIAGGAADGSDAARVTGANLVAALNAEYRVPFERQPRGSAASSGPKPEAAFFFDAGTAWLLPRWLGTSPPALLEGTNGLVRASTGAELRIPLPVVNQSLRFYYAANPLRFAGSRLLADGSLFRARDRRTAFGWGLGSFF